MKYLQILVLPFLFFACTTVAKKTKPTTTIQSRTTKTITKTPAYVPEPAPYRPSEQKTFRLIHTKLDVSFDWNKQTMFGKATLSVAPYFYNQHTITLDAQGYADISVSLLAQDGTTQKLNYQYLDSVKLKINLGKTFTRKDTLKLYITYIAQPNELDTKGGRAITDRRGLYFINPLGEEKGKPRQIWTQGEPEASSCWFPTIDSPNQKSTQEMYITVDTNFITLSNGALQYSIDNDNGTRTDCWKQDQPHAPYLFMMAVGEFVKIQDTWQDIDVDYYVEKEYAPYAKAIFGNTPEMMTFFSELLSYDYPWAKYSQIIVRDYVSGAMENTSATIFMEQVQLTDKELLDKDWDYIIAHELFHHWFGDLVTCKSWSNLTLNESFANYSEYLWFEHKYGRNRADAHRLEEMKGYLSQARTLQHPIVNYHYNTPMDMFDRHSYNKGGLVLHMLRKHLGDDAFFSSLSRYLNQNQYTDAEIHELRLAFEDETGLDLKWFFDQWYMKAGHPQLQVDKIIKGDTLLLTITQQQDTLYTPIYKLPLKVGLWNAVGKETQYDIQITQAKQMIAIPLTETPTAIVFDAEHQLLAEITENYTLQERINLYKWSDKFQDRYDALEYMQAIMSTKQNLTQTDSIKKVILNTFLLALKDDYHEIRQKAIQGLYTLNYSPQLEKYILYQAKHDKKSLVRADAIRFLATQHQELSPALKTLFSQSLNDSSYTVLAASLSALAISNIALPPATIDKYKQLNKLEVSKGILEYYTATKDTSNLNWALQTYLNLNSIDKIGLSPLLGIYTMNQTKENKEKIINILNQIALTDKQKYARFSAYKALYYMHRDPLANKYRKKIVSKETDPVLVDAYARYEYKLNN